MHVASQSFIPASRELVINWHVTEACNYRCRYCYAHWEEGTKNRELLHDEAACRRLLEQLAAYFDPDNACNALHGVLQWSSLRLNLAGGEPLLYGSRILQIARSARELGMKVSIITNGSLLTRDRIAELAALISVLGVSVDTASGAAAREIGRVDRQGQVLLLPTLQQRLSFAREINPALEVKVNTVVNALNHEEDMTRLIEAIAPQRWKVLRMLPSVTHDLAVTANEFEEFVRRHLGSGLPICAEDNGDMTQSYIMIDPQGRFFQNTAGVPGYLYSPPILEVGIEPAFSGVEFAACAYLRRYQSVGVEV